MPSTFARLAELPVTIDSYALEGMSKHVSSGFERLSTVIRLRGEGEEGVGEDVVYDAPDHLALQQAGPVQPLPGSWTLAELVAHVDALDLFPVEPERGEVSRLYRRWAFQSAALDLALRQAGRSLHDVLDREPSPLNFVVSLHLADEDSVQGLRGLLGRYPGLRLKLDATASWDDQLIAELVALGAVDSVDFKAFYRDTPVDNPPDAALYRRVAEAFPDAWLEDPDVSDPDTGAALAEHHERITWDAPIHSVADIESRPFRPKMVNIKPSRFGPLSNLFAAYDFCEAEGIGAYGGGQTELGVGRGQIQYLASLFHPDTPNDVAPGGYNLPDTPEGLPSSPLDPAAEPTGFRWRT